MKRRVKARVTTTNADIDAAIAEAKLYEQYRPKAVKAEYRASSDTVAIKLHSGVEIIIPRKLLQGLESAKAADVRKIEIWGHGSGVHWPRLDVDHYVPSLIEGVFGNRRWMSAIGKKGGAKRSDAKAAASRKNGQKGGRPRKKAAA